MAESTPPAPAIAPAVLAVGGERLAVEGVAAGLLALLAAHARCINGSQAGSVELRWGDDGAHLVEHLAHGRVRWKDARHSLC